MPAPDPKPAPVPAPGRPAAPGFIIDAGCAEAGFAPDILPKLPIPPPSDDNGEPPPADEPPPAEDNGDINFPIIELLLPPCEADDPGVPEPEGVPFIVAEAGSIWGD